MSDHRPVFVIFILMLCFLRCSTKSKHPGDQKPFGSSGPFDQIEEITDGFPNPLVFFDKYVQKSRPVLFRQVLANDPHRSMWENDEQLNEIFANNDEIVHVETKKKESRQQEILSITMKEFLQRYRHEELYLVEEVPPLLRRYFTIPKCLQCEPAIETFQVAMMWFSSGNTSSVVHTDDYDNINCVLQGNKRFILVDPNENPEVAIEIIDNPTGSYSSIDVDKVNYQRYPSLNDENVHYYSIEMKGGDCLFLPSLWIHQVRSTDRNIAVNYWLEHERTKTAQVDQQSCAIIDESNLMTLESIQWPSSTKNLEYLKNFMLDLIDDDVTNFKDWTKAFSKEFGFELQSNVQTISWFAEVFNIIDTNGNGYLTNTEIESLFTNDNATVVYDILQEILSIMEVKLGKTIPSNDTMTDNNADEEIVFENYQNNETFVDDDDQEEQNDIDKHNDL